MTREELQKLVEESVCTRCGGTLEIIKVEGECETPLCRSCSMTNWGCLPDIYEKARRAVDDFSYRYYKRYDAAGDEVGTRKANISKMVDIYRLFRSMDMEANGD